MNPLRALPEFECSTRDFHAALLAAINDPTEAPALDCFPEWRDAHRVALDAPWPEKVWQSRKPMEQ